MFSVFFLSKRYKNCSIGASSPLFFAEIRHVDQIQLRNSSPAQKSSKKTLKMITSRYKTFVYLFTELELHLQQYIKWRYEKFQKSKSVRGWEGACRGAANRKALLSPPPPPPPPGTEKGERGNTRLQVRGRGSHFERMENWSQSLARHSVYSILRQKTGHSGTLGTVRIILLRHQETLTVFLLFVS